MPDPPQPNICCIPSVNTKHEPATLYFSSFWSSKELSNLFWCLRWTDNFKNTSREARLSCNTLKYNNNNSNNNPICKVPKALASEALAAGQP